MKRFTNNPWVVCLVASGFLFFQFFQIAAFNVLIPDLIVSLHTSSSSLSMLSALYFYGTIVFLVPAGVLLDNLSTRTIILLAMALSMFGVFLFTISESFYVAALGRFLIGVSGGPFGFLSSMRLAARWFPPQRLAFVTGIIVALAMLGGVIAQMPFATLIDLIGWRDAMWINLGVGAVIAVTIYLLVKDYPAGQEQEYLKQLNYCKNEGFVKGLKIVVFSKQNWFAGLFASLLNLPIFVLGALWGMLYLVQIHAMPRLHATIICSLLFLGMLIGAPLFGYISDRWRLRKMPMLLGAVICISATIFVIESSFIPWHVLGFAFFAIGFGSSSQTLAYPMVAESNPPALAGSALSIASTLIMAGGAIAQPIFGWMIDKQWSGLIIDGIPSYSPADYKFALWILPVAILASMIMVFLLRETYCRPSTDR